LLARSGEERLKMGCSMHAAARAMVLASTSEKSAVAAKQALFLRFYRDEFGPSERKKILAALRNAAGHQGKQRRKAKQEGKKSGGRDPGC
jgi:hypothetical protein